MELKSTVAQFFTPLNLVALWILYRIGLVIYRLWLSPLAKIPGPKLAALTHLYSFYYDVICGGQYIWRIQEMHRKYGPIVRVMPDVVHVNDHRFVGVLFTQSPKIRRDRHKTFTGLMATTGSMLATGAHELHRKRRAALNPFFSQQSVRTLEPIVQRTLTDLLRRMEGWADGETPVKILVGFRAATKDIIHEYSFGEGPRFLDMPDCNKSFFKILEPSSSVYMRLYAPWLMDAIPLIPKSIALFLMPYISGFIQLGGDIAREIEAIRAAKEPPERKTIFHDILDNDALPMSEKTTRRLTDESLILIIAGTDTTATTLRSILYHALSDPALLRRLKTELEAALPDKNETPDISKLHSLPLLNAVINEVIRFHPSATHRQSRTSPNEAIIYTAPNGISYKIPAGAGITMDAPFINRHPDLYDRPDEFLPDRYLEDPASIKHLFSFSKGTRQCIGIHLAYQTLQIFTAGILRKYDLYDPSQSKQSGPTLELYQTSLDDIAMHGDFVTPGVRPGSEDLRIIIRK